MEADADKRKKGLNPRAVFSDPSSSESSYESKGTVTINTKGAKTCITRQLKIKVVTLYRQCPFSLNRK